jgi:hypothetical protein
MLLYLLTRNVHKVCGVSSVLCNALRSCLQVHAQGQEYGFSTIPGSGAAHLGSPFAFNRTLLKDAAWTIVTMDDGVQ